MKLVITTQIRENYAAHNGFTGEYYWKMKGGNTYVVENLSSKHVDKILDNGIPTLTKLIEEKSDYFEEYVIGWTVVGDDDNTLWADWETPVVLSWGGDRWLANRTVRNDGEYNCMRASILAKREEWIPLEGGERGHYKCEYQTVNGEWVAHKDLEKALEAA